MKNLNEDTEAVSIVVGAILLLAILVTFMSVFTSTWVPIYVSDDEAAHSEQVHHSMLELKKQAEIANSVPNTVSIDLGTDDLPYIKDSNSVGYLDLNESAGKLLITSTIESEYVPSNMLPYSFGIAVEELDTNVTNPITSMQFEFLQDPSEYTANDKLAQNFDIHFRTTTYNRWIQFKNADVNDKHIRISLSGGYPSEKWISEDIKLDGTDDSKIYLNNDPRVLHIDCLTKDTNLTLKKSNQPLLINGTNYNISDSAPLYDLIQHYMKLGGNYLFDYVNYDGVAESSQIFEYQTTNRTTNVTYVNNTRIITMNNSEISKGTLKMESDYNFMVDQQYIYDSGALILQQKDGVVFKTQPPIQVSNRSGDVGLSINTILLKGDIERRGNDMENLYITANSVETINGYTENVTITKYPTEDTWDLWYNYFREMEDEIQDVGPTSVTFNNTSEYVRLNIEDSSPGIYLSMKSSEITIN
ncbi:hypothetical protein [Methanohalophilus portucalensis]|uniref:Uncharacterized protein n=2 Tax=Methanohalophilus portucalensis TaxID=39664 RepID=A0A1L9C3S7_9EURY|nr:hypothetical protein [Methanohalophilus portucalensis]ATU07427.1 hypothetical protein BKM01_00710 [Methanohalophilus portucalensis]OJH49116.1 hypothetical protein MPF_1619 [Methanohalophilus portucalensis FDF-1]RNI08083.1 hypothetical protein EFE41_10555 [Methanohalophilus portucalensis FDF-1]SMH39379.1 hypothetical protein SAMN06264941_1376 [Methanohalophilus portucalensis FDF-1]